MVAKAQAQKKTILWQQAKPVFFVVKAVIEPHEIRALKLYSVGAIAMGNLGGHAGYIGAGRRAGRVKRLEIRIALRGSHDMIGVRHAQAGVVQADGVLSQSLRIWAC